MRETYESYLAAVINGDHEAQNTLHGALLFERELALECAQEELRQAKTLEERAIIRKTIDALRRER